MDVATDLSECAASLCGAFQSIHESGELPQSVFREFLSGVSSRGPVGCPYTTR